MSNSTIRFFVSILSVILMTGFAGDVKGQVFDPNDPIVVYDPANPPAQPAWGQVGKWVKTNRVSWNTSDFKSYIYKGMAFRLKYPRNYVPGNGTKYALFIFFHGMGEPGPIYDNEYQLYHGAQAHRNMVNNGTYDGFLLYPQNTEGPFTATHRQILAELIEKFLVPEVQVDPFRVTVSGLSGGGSSSWSFMRNYPQLTASAVPMSSVSGANITENLFLPVWLFQGALDIAPPPATARALAKQSAVNGGNFTYTEYPNRGHDTWNYAWKEPDYYPFIKRAHKANPWVLHRRTSFCPGETINLTLGVTAGFEAYEWRKDGTVIAGATGNTLNVTSIGKYDCRLKRKGEWSPWSPIPVDIAYQGGSDIPEIQMKEFASRVLPSPDGKTSLELVVPEGYSGYKWVDASNAQVASTYNYLAQPGTYRVSIRGSATCETGFSAPFTVINANGPNKPDSVVNLILNKVSKSSLRLDWLSNPTAAHPATEFEVYMATKAGGPYRLAGITAETSYIADALTPGVKYYFVVRAINNTAAAPLSREVSGSTDVDNVPPTSPQNLKVVGTTQSSISVSWTEATDDVGVLGYDVYVNGVKTTFTDKTTYTIYNLSANQHYTVSVKAKDQSGNESPASNQVTAQAISQGLIYKYYTYTGSISALPNFDEMDPVSVGVMPNVSIDNRTQETNYAYMWEGEITIPVSGTYKFRTYSDDGSKLYIGTPYSHEATPLVNNDGSHTAQYKEGSIYLEAGVYPITVTYFQATAGQTMAISWTTPQSGGAYVPIPNSAFAGTPTTPGGAVPAKPTELTIVAPTLYNKVSLSWKDNSSNETAFEVFRSDNGLNFNTIAVLPANSVAYQDTTVAGATKYYYQVRAINQYGESDFDRSGRGVHYAYYETGIISQIPDFNTMLPVKTGRTTNFSLGMQERLDYFAVKYTGVITLPVSGSYTFYVSSNDGAKIYIGGEAETDVVVNHDGLQEAGNEVSQAKHLNAGTYPIVVKYFEATGDEVLIVSYKGPDGSGIDKQVIPFSVLGEEPVNVTTPVAPPAPGAPANLEAYERTSSSIRLKWTSNSGTNATKYQVYRSYRNNTDYFLYAELPADATTFSDTDLFSSTLFYYKVKAIGPGGESAFSNEVSATTLGLPAVIGVIENQYMKYGTQLQVPVTASNGSTEVLQLLAENLPAFGSFSSSGNNAGVITFSPNQSQQGVYNNITVKAINPQNDTTIISFSLTVNDNNPPVISDFQHIVMNEWETAEININATDADAGDALTWTFTQKPAFAVSEINNNSVKFTFSPKHTQAGVYNMLITVKDPKQGKDTATLTITVNPTSIPGRRVYVNFSSGAIAGPSTGWNNTNTATVPVNTTFSSLKDENGGTTTLGLKIVSSGFGVGNDGMNTGANSGVYPDNVLQSHYWIDGSRNIEISGLNASKRYNFTFFGSYNNDDRIYSAKYTIGTESVSLNAAKNTSNTAIITNVLAPENGILTLNIDRADDNNATRAYLTAIVIDELVDDASAPARPINMAARLESDTVKLSWTNVAYNADSYEVYRGVRLSGPYMLLNPGVTDNKLEHFDDASTASNKTYYYIVRVRNEHGVSNSQIVWVNVPNKAPKIEEIADVYLKVGETKNINISAVDDPTETVTLAVSGLPSFATFTDNGGGKGVITISSSDALATYPGITVTATDNYGASSSREFAIHVIDKLMTSTYINFNSAANPSNTAPWNDFNAGAAVAAGATLTHPKNELAATTPYVIRINEAMSSHAEAISTGNNGGVYADAVITTGFKSTAATRTVTVSGLPAGKYNLVFYGSSPSLDAPKQVYAVGSVKDTLDVASNFMKTARLVGLTPVNNQITVTISKLPSNSANIYLGALVIEAHNMELTPPSNLRVKKNRKTSLEIEWDVNESASGSTLELWRSSAPGTGYVKIADLSGTAKSYTDNGLTPATVYYYKMRARNGGSVSEYSPYLGAATVQYTIDVNFNDGSPGSMAPAPWNNTNQLLTDGFELSNMMNADYQRTGINLSVVQNFNGYDDFNGSNTGNNSGVVPDNVMKSFYYIQYGELVKLKVTGLNQSMSYNFVFFSSSKDPIGIYTHYIIGDKTAVLDWRNNTTNTAQINAMPDATGSVEILIMTATQGSKGYLNGLSIQAVPVAPGGSGGTSGRGGTDEQVSLTGTGNSADVKASQITIGAYPTPFVNDVTVDLNLKVAKPKLVVLLRDGAGKLVFSRILENVPAGRSLHKLDLSGKNTTSGVYYLQVLSTHDGESSVIKIMK